MERLPDLKVNEIMQSNEIKDEVCIICLNDILTLEENGLHKPVVRLSCNRKTSSHYHKNCLSEWLSLKSTCPLCRDEDILSTHLLYNDCTSNSDGQAGA
jgi:hypothetical protein